MGASNTLSWQALWYHSNPPSPSSAPNQGRALADACALCHLAADKPICWSSEGLSSPRAIQQATPSVSLSHIKSSVVPAGTQHTRSLKGPWGSVTPHEWLCPNQPGWCVCKTGLCQPFRQQLGAWLQHPGHLQHVSLCLPGMRDQSLCLGNLGSPEIPQACF